MTIYKEIVTRYGTLEVGTNWTKELLRVHTDSTSGDIYLNRYQAKAVRKAIKQWLKDSK